MSKLGAVLSTTYVPEVYWLMQTADRSLPNDTNTNQIFDTTTNGTITLGLDNNNPLGASARGGSASVSSVSFTPVVTQGTGTGLTAMSKGIFRVSSAGTLIPSIALTTASSATLKAGSYIKIKKIGESSETYVGSWT